MSPEVKVNPVRPDVTERAGTTPAWRILIDGRDLVDLGLDGAVQQIYVEEDDTKADLLRLDIYNYEGRHTDDFVFMEGAKVEVWAGFHGQVGVVLEYRGAFYLDRPEFDFPRHGPERVRLTGYGESERLAADHKRSTWENLTDSQIARQIAMAYNLEFDVDETPRTYRAIVQANETDIAFLQRRAQMYGFVAYIETGKLHFHALRRDRTNVTLVHRTPGSPIRSFRAQVERYRMAPRVTATQVDPLTGDQFTVHSDPAVDPIRKAMVDIRPARDAQTLSGAPEKFVCGEGQIRDPSEMQSVVNAVASTSRWLVRATADIRAIPTIRSRRTLNLENIGKLSGEYYVKTVTHKVTGAYVMRLELRRTFTGGVTLPQAPSALTSSSGVRMPVKGGPEQVALAEEPAWDARAGGGA